MIYKTPHINQNIEQQESHKNVDEIRCSGRVAFIHGVCYKISGILPKYFKKTLTIRKSRDRKYNGQLHKKINTAQHEFHLKPWSAQKL